jgi:hypothetical protein
VIVTRTVWRKGEATDPLGNPAIISSPAPLSGSCGVPVGFIGCLIGTWLRRREQFGLVRFAEVRVRSTAGLGAEVAPVRRCAPASEPAPGEPVVAR